MPGEEQAQEQAAATMGSAPPPPPPPPQEAPVSTAVDEDEEVVFYPTDGPVTDTTITVAEGELAVEEAEVRFFHSTRQGTDAHVAAKQALEEARANLRVARKNRRY